MYGMVGNDPVNLVDVLGLNPCCPDGKPVDCKALQARLDRLSLAIRDAINDLSDYNDYFENARTNAGYSLGQSALFGFYAVSGLYKGLATNAARTGPVVIKTGADKVPTAVFSESGKLLRVGQKGFREAVRIGTNARNVGAAVTGLQTAGPEVAQFAGKEFFDTADRILDPAENLARTQVATGDELSRQLSDTIKVMQDAYRSLRDRINECCK